MTANLTDPVETAAFSGTTGAPSRRRVGLVFAGAVILVVAAAATSLAASNAPSTPTGARNEAPAGGSATGDVDGPDLKRFGRQGFGNITIEAISGNDVTLKTDDGWRRTIAISSSVALTKGGQDIAVADLRVGDQVRFRQTRNDDGTYTVTALAVIVPSIRGEASDVTSSGFKVTTRDGSVWTVTVNSSTAYSFGQGTGSLSDVKAGERVGVSGTITADNAMTATSVRVAADRAVGRVTAKTADSITIQKRDGTNVTIHVDADTTYRVAGVEDADLGDVVVDMAIGVTGRARADGSIDADAVAAGKLRGLGRADRNGQGGFVAPGMDLPDLSNPAFEPDLADPGLDVELFLPTA
jgi:hypothetical protein